MVFRAADLKASVRVYRSLVSVLPWTPLVAWWRTSGLELVRRPLAVWSPETDSGRLALLISVLLLFTSSYSFVIARRMKPTFATAALGAVLLTVCVLRFSSVSHFLYYFF